MDFETHLKSFLENTEANTLLSALEKPQKHSFLLNTLKVNQINEIFEDVHFKRHPYVMNGYYYDKEKEQLGKNILFEAGAYYIQEPSAMMAVEILDPKPNEMVLDMCAAPGGKSIHAINKMHDKGLLICNDVVPLRAKILSSNIEKYGARQCIVLNESIENLKSHFLNAFDKIILDAPCSGSGMFRKNEFSKTDWSLFKVMECAKIQKSLLESAYLMLKGKGRLLYSTCSYSIQENEEVIFEFLKTHEDMQIIPIELKEGMIEGIHLKGAIRLHPNHFEGEGHFICLLEKRTTTPPANLKMQHRKKSLSFPVLDFLNQLPIEYKKDFIVEKNDEYYLLNDFLLDLGNLNVLRYGLHLGKMIHHRFEPNHALAMTYNKNILPIELNEEEAIDYLKGLILHKEGNEGYKVVSYKKLPLGFVKQVQGILKNHYPKGLRKSL